MINKKIMKEEKQASLFLFLFKKPKKRLKEKTGN
jgi:hypothetical protein